MLFTVRAKPDKTLVQASISEKVLGHAKKRGQNYKLVWGKRATTGASSSVEQAVPFKAPLLAGGELDVGAVIGNRPLVLVFFATWCKPCLQEAPHIQALYRKYSPKGVVFLGVSIDKPEARDKLRTDVRKLGLHYPVALDPDSSVLGKYATGKSKGIPLTLVFAESGKLLYQHGNYQPGDEVELGRVLGSLRFD